MKWISIFASMATMVRRSIERTRHVVLTACVLSLLLTVHTGWVQSAAPALPPSAKDLYQAAQSSDREARAALAQSSDRPDSALSLVRAAMRAYRTVVVRHPTSGYCDDALWYGALLGADAFGRFGHQHDRDETIALLTFLRSEYPFSPFIPRIKPTLEQLAAPDATAAFPSASPAIKASPPGTVQDGPFGKAPATDSAPPAAARLPSVAPARPSTALTTGATQPATPATTGRGGYSMARQLGLRVGRVVIDPGHGGTDPGALGVESSESKITLDIALKLETLLTAAAGVDVVLTRRSDVYVGLQERTAIANRENADLFVSIHVNANADESIKGIETFLLNFASTPSAAAVAARENAGSTDTMSHLDGMVKQIALGNKLEESRELATQVQTAMVKRLRATDKGLRDLGVRQAPFVVLIGASMPSVLVEVAFLTNRHERQLLATNAYRQRVAEALSDGLGRYLRALKKVNAVPGPPPVSPAASVRR